MAAQADACARCSEPIRGRQQFLPCVSCGQRFHCKCLGIRSEEYNFLMQSGSSSYKCVKCVKRPDPSTVQLASAVDTADTPPEGPEAFSELAGSACGSVSPNVMTLMQKMVTQIDALTFEVRQLRAENVTLRVEIRDLRECVVGQTDFPPLRYAKQPAALAPPAQSFACVAATGPGFSGDGTRSQPSTARPLRKVTHPSANPVSNPARPPATFGTAKHCTLQVAPKSLAARGLFISRLAPSTKASDVQELLAGLVGDRTVTCTRLKTRHHSYNSFHVALDEGLLDIVNKPEVWPSGCVFRPFYGSLSPSRFFEESDVTLTTTNDVAEN
ncbi:hypothetical protein HPB47_011664 [Ixodes persulcatus]|uniref:Uncharacterized protein n=1 Tax=Ixodes persulcatus TaxID=34615 RepID=A0AC60NVM5_IXOPE|nr:hypothetical protein HPB47_011664 [Ixodes persulcatus]